MKISICSACGYILDVTDETCPSAIGLPPISHGLGEACKEHLYGPALRAVEERRAVRRAIQADDDSVEAEKLREYVEANR